MRSFVLLRYPQLALLKVLYSINSAITVITSLQSEKLALANPLQNVM